MALTMEEAQRMNVTLAEGLTEGVLQRVRRQVAEEREKAAPNAEVYCTLAAPQEAGDAERAYFTELLAGSAENPAYQDFARSLMQRVREGLEREGLQVFVTLNCRFDASFADNLLLYVLVSLKGKAAGQ